MRMDARTEHWKREHAPRCPPLHAHGASLPHRIWLAPHCPRLDIRIQPSSRLRSGCDSVPIQVLGYHTHAHMYLAGRLCVQSEPVDGRADYFTVLERRHAAQEECCEGSTEASGPRDMRHGNWQVDVSSVKH